MRKGWMRPLHNCALTIMAVAAAPVDERNLVFQANSAISAFLVLILKKS